MNEETLLREFAAYLDEQRRMTGPERRALQQQQRSDRPKIEKPSTTKPPTSGSPKPLRGQGNRPIQGNPNRNRPTPSAPVKSEPPKEKPTQTTTTTTTSSGGGSSPAPKAPSAPSAPAPKPQSKNMGDNYRSWAKANPGLAKKVKPGQAGHSSIKGAGNMGAKAATAKPGKFDTSTPKVDTPKIKPIPKQGSAPKPAKPMSSLAKATDVKSDPSAFKFKG